MPGKIKFLYRPAMDVVIATVDWTVDSEDDVSLWYEEYRAYFTGRFNRKVDLILELSNFHLSPKIGNFFGQFRAQVLSEFVDRSYRVNQHARERAFMYTSSALHGAPANHYESVEDAVAALLADRAPTAGSRPPSSAR